MSFSIRNDDSTQVVTLADGTATASVNGVRIFSAPGQPFCVSLKQSKVPFLIIPRPTRQVENPSVHLDIQMLVEHALRARASKDEPESEPLDGPRGKKRAREEADEAVAAEDAPKKKKPRKPLTEEQKAARKAAAEARKAKKAEEAAAAAAASAAPAEKEDDEKEEEEEEEDDDDSTKG
jgi:hypothetical protein